MEYCYQDWKFLINEFNSEQYYKERPVVFDSINDYLPELTDFLSHIGVDIRKPCKFNKADTTDLCYYVFGKATSKEGYEIDFYGENKLVSVAILKGDAEQERFMIAVFGVRLEDSL